MLHPHVDAAIDDHEQEDEEAGDDSGDDHPERSFAMENPKPPSIALLELQPAAGALMCHQRSIPHGENPKAKQSKPKKSRSRRKYRYYQLNCSCIFVEPL